MRGLCLAVAILLTGSVCSASALDALADAEAQWRNLNVRDYEFQYRRTEVAFTLEGQAAAVTVRVRPGRPAQMRFSESQGRYKAGTSVPKRLRANFPDSVEALFAVVRSDLDSAEDRDIVTAYDAAYAFPDYHSNRSVTMTDDDGGFVVSNFRILGDF
jgi:Family of unknown function (DUF6174)